MNRKISHRTWEINN